MESQLVDELISCPKTIKTPPKKQMAVNARNEFTFRNDFSCISSDGKVFEVFMRLNTQFPHIFSIGLRYKSDQGTFTLCRYNGKHQHRNKIVDKNVFDDFHIHKLFDRQLSDNSSANMDAQTTTRYITFNEALYAFLNDCRITGWQVYFPDLENAVNQLKMEGV